MRPPLRLGEFAMPKYEIVTLPETHLIGTTQSYSCSLEQISEFRHQMRVQFWRDFLSHAPRSRRSVWSQRNASKPGKRRRAGGVLHHRADAGDGQWLHSGFKPVVLEGGEYVMFAYEGLGTGVQEFILTVYGTCMPMLNLNRRKGQDIERYYPAQDAKPEEGPINLRMEFLIPIRR
jgi:AraC family transcriptional activator of mar-sox-rob regulon